MVQSQSGSLRGLKALVAFLGILVVLGTAVVAGVIIRRLYASPPSASNVSPPPAAAAATPGAAAGIWKLPASGPISLPTGAKITGIAATNGVFAVAVSTPHGDELWIINAATGARYATLVSKP